MAENGRGHWVIEMEHLCIAIVQLSRVKVAQRPIKLTLSPSSSECTCMIDLFQATT
jgi:hypothetical protein